MSRVRLSLSLSLSLGAAGLCAVCLLGQQVPARRAGGWVLVVGWAACHAVARPSLSPAFLLSPLPAFLTTAPLSSLPYRLPACVMVSCGVYSAAILLIILVIGRQCGVELGCLHLHLVTVGVSLWLWWRLLRCWGRLETHL